jgi:SRSO17 transposase
MSVGVARQWSGRLGKVENCQVAVFAALVQGLYSTLIDVRLYLPQEWTQDLKRCLAAGVPESEAVLKSKADLAFEMVVHARQIGVRFSWVGVDGGYGKDPAFLRRLEDHGEVFVAQVHRDQQIYLEDPDPCVPERKGSTGRPRTQLQAQSAGQRVDEWVAAQPAELWLSGVN